MTQFRLVLERQPQRGRSLIQLTPSMQLQCLESTKADPVPLLLLLHLNPETRLSSAFCICKTAESAAPPKSNPTCKPEMIRRWFDWTFQYERHVGQSMQHRVLPLDLRTLFAPAIFGSEPPWTPRDIDEPPWSRGEEWKEWKDC